MIWRDFCVVSGLRVSCGGTTRRLHDNRTLFNGSKTLTPLLRHVLGSTLRNRVSTRLDRRRHSSNGHHGNGVDGGIRAGCNRIAVRAPHSQSKAFRPRAMGGHRAVLTGNVTSRVVRVCTVNADAHSVDDCFRHRFGAALSTSAVDSVASHMLPRVAT